jgi:hypothetical protein
VTPNLADPMRAGMFLRGAVAARTHAGTGRLAGAFVVDIRADHPAAPVAERIVEALVRLAHALALSVTAYAVETATGLDRPREQGCGCAAASATPRRWRRSPPARNGRGLIG